MATAPTFRTETRAWLEENCPPAMRSFMPEHEQVAGGKQARYVRPEQKQWLDRMAAKGWTAPTWPTQYGGGGLSNDEALILEEEMQDLGCRTPLRGMGLSMLGPVLLEYGTEEQRQTHIPPIVRGEIRWCQGYSEPEAGSDLASLRTRAVLQGDHFLVNGHKIWTSNAHVSDWIFCLVRTDPTAKKHEGISFLLIDMDDPGVRPRPIRLISGASVFCETFLENVRVPAGNLVGPLNKGWTIAKRLLEHERKGIGGIAARNAAKFEIPLEAVAKRYAGEARRQNRRSRFCVTVSRPLRWMPTPSSSPAGGPPRKPKPVRRRGRYRRCSSCRLPNSTSAATRCCSKPKAFKASAGRVTVSPTTSSGSPANGCAPRPTRSRAARPRSS